MCDAVSVPGTDEALHTLSEMRAHGWEVTDEDSEDWDDEWCLCGVDVEAILDRNVGEDHWLRHPDGWYEVTA